ncbi:HEPN domain-containing protein, partial [Patescibacteria group bacterium]|nr:HEPN domain-containing protein [Patescibacteria group bacterium]
MQDNNQKLSKEWIIKSQNDLKSAEILFKEEGPTDSICLHCHQTAEKALKGFLVFSEKEFPKVHDL